MHARWHQYPLLLYLCRDMVVCCGMCSPCLCTLSASAPIHPAVPTFSRFLLEIFLNFHIRDMKRKTSSAVKYYVKKLKLRINQEYCDFCLKN